MLKKMDDLSVAEWKKKADDPKEFEVKEGDDSTTSNHKESMKRYFS